MRRRTIEMSVINVAMQSPHAPSRYIDLFKAAIELDVAIPLRSNHAAQISCRFPTEDADLPEFISGTIDKYYDLKKNAPWFNQRRARKAEDHELDAVQDLPDELKPAYESFMFVFHLQKHLFFLLSKESGEGSMSSGQAGMFLQHLFDHSDLTSKFGHTAVTVVPRKGVLDWILELDRLTRFEIDFFAPNADDDDELEIKITNKLDQMHAVKMTTAFTAREHNSLDLDQETKQQARVAAKNGVVVGRGSMIDGKSETRSTVDQPLVEKLSYIPSLMTRYDVLVEKARQIIQGGLRI